MSFLKTKQNITKKNLHVASSCGIFFSLSVLDPFLKALAPGVKQIHESLA